ncbi:uncharacterized protein N7496_004274 [Penicillium cataractarum]|uniref:Uncharacterized protein n=1 Tax=Penicillium cataractarum TaxID=2100454 RepID=A0A9W9SNT8_9EURO|nr:uncharacterized protein N7496_004274 [Penicillium cataractarum]KAJ5381846.1 hypothetical protein N7496_004274 [Penicillium cataractarum]
MEPQITPNTFCTYTGRPKDATTTVFFISGNPGLIGYYHPFLSLLGEYLANSGDRSSTQHVLKKTDSSIQIYGCSLGGFEVQSQNASPTMTTGDAYPDRRSTLYDLEDQIVFVHDKLNTLMSQNASSANDPSESSARRKVILIGHSVGAYIAMEVLRRHREVNPVQADNGYTVDFDIIGGVMLFPTVKDIAHSPSGQKLTTLLSFIPHLALVVSFFARILTTLLPTPALKALVKLVMHNPPAHALDTTTSFLKSAGGVRQALHMAADEMRTITSDKWTDDIWGVTHAREPLTRLFFYFGRNDHWVAEKTRDEIVAVRGCKNADSEGEGLGPRMFVCEEGLPHAFCLKHGDVMARKVARMIREIGSA